MSSVNYFSMRKLIYLNYHLDYIACIKIKYHYPKRKPLEK